MDPTHLEPRRSFLRPTARRALLAVAAAGLIALAACSPGSDEADIAQKSPETANPPPAVAVPEPAPAAATTPDSLPLGLAIGLAPFEEGPDGKLRPGAARLELLKRADGAWSATLLDDPESNVFHKAMTYTPPGAEPGIVTLGGMQARVKLWRHANGEWTSETLWAEDFGEKRSRMRDVEVGAIVSEDPVDLAVATHDQGVVAVIVPDGQGGFTVRELDRQEETIVHEIELGDLDGDGVLEVYATPSEPNRLDGTPQPGAVVRYVPAKDEGRVVVAALGDRHAKEILVDDVDGDGRDELYVSVEGKKDGRKGPILEPVEIRRFDADTDPEAGRLVARVEGDWLTRFLTPGDVDGDGKKEIVAATYSKGLWLLRPASDPDAEWTATLIDSDSRGFEHSSLLTDLDGDGVDELYVSSDPHGEVRRYVWTGQDFAREVIHTRPPNSAFSWNIMPIPAELLP